VALKCPGGTPAISLGFQSEVSVAQQHYALRRDASDASSPESILRTIHPAFRLKAVLQTLLGERNQH